MDPNAGPQQLQKKVIFDIRMYFARRGQENFQTMSKDTFKVVNDTTLGIKYVCDKMENYLNKKTALVGIQSF